MNLTEEKVDEISSGQRPPDNPDSSRDTDPGASSEARVDQPKSC